MIKVLISKDCMVRNDHELTNASSQIKNPQGQERLNMFFFF